MIGKLLGALVGREIDRKRGESGVKGALLGAVAAGALRRLGPSGWCWAGLMSPSRRSIGAKKRGTTG